MCISPCHTLCAENLFICQFEIEIFRKLWSRMKRLFIRTHLFSPLTTRFSRKSTATHICNVRPRLRRSRPNPSPRITLYMFYPYSNKDKQSRWHRFFSQPKSLSSVKFYVSVRRHCIWSIPPAFDLKKERNKMGVFSKVGEKTRRRGIIFRQEFYRTINILADGQTTDTRHWLQLQCSVVSLPMAVVVIIARTKGICFLISHGCFTCYNKTQLNSFINRRGEGLDRYRKSEW